MKLNNWLSFLNIKIIGKNKLTTVVYGEPVFNGVFTNFESFTQHLYNCALIFTFLHTAFKLCSNFELIHHELVNSRSIFRKNG